MDTIKLYQHDAYLKTSVSKISEVITSKNLISLVLNETVFFPTGGGQSCDKGQINGFEVVSVYEKDGTVYHDLQCAEGSAVWNVGDSVTCEINWEHRFLNMQRHCGEHILSGIFYREYGGVNRGFHMGEDYMTIDISLEENPEYDTLTWDMVSHAEKTANQVVWSNAPVVIRYFATKAETENLPLRKKLSIEENISIVCVGDVNNPEDCVACCGTHPSTAGQVGLIKILKVESYKGMFRVYCEAGQKAMALFDRYHDTISALGNKYSASIGDLLEKISAQDDKNKAVRNELYVLKQSVMKSRIDALRADLSALRVTDAKGTTDDLNVTDGDLTASSGYKYGDKIFVVAYDDLKTDDLLNIGRPLIPDLDRLLLIVSKPEKIVLLFSDGKINCGKLVKENASIYQGKGGGNDTSARALFPKAESIDTFIDLLDKHLR